MYSTAYLLRLSKSLLVAGIGLLLLLITFNNITDYYTNYFFVQHVLEMDTIFRESVLHYRSIHQPFIFHAEYIFIIALEAFITFCCCRGAWLLFKNINQPATVFTNSKRWGIAGVLCGIIVWFIGFEVIGGEWFVMWQSTVWNGLLAAERILNVLLFTLILLHLRDEELNGN